MKKAQKTIVISLGGSIIVPEEIQVPFLKKFKEFILKFLRKDYRFIIVAGGGRTCRKYQNAAASITQLNNEDKDWLGIHATRINAHLLRAIFKNEAYSAVLDNPYKKINGKDFKLFIASGWRPGWSTDYDAVILAKRFGASKIINASNIDYIYPVKSRVAGISPKAKLFNRVNDKNIVLDKTKPIKQITWPDYLKIAGRKWTPGMNVPFDPIASQLAQKLKMTVIFTKGDDLSNMADIIRDKNFNGTTIHP